MSNNLNQGVLFTNDNPTSDKSPGFTGSINVGGKEYRLAAWQNTAKDGSKDYLSIKVTEPDPSRDGISKPQSPNERQPATPAARKPMF